jgi:diguanylate cyclase (GGDEF)-like protein
MVDVDDFKAINDRFGHATGDAALVAVAGHLVEAVRASDRVARIGGDEFVVLLPETDEVAAHRLADRLRGSRPVAAGARGEAPTVSISIGVASAVDADTIDSLLARADAAMYRDKRARRAG